MFELIQGGNVTYHPGSTFNPTRQAILNHVPRNEAEREHARVILMHRAPDLLRMVMGE